MGDISEVAPVELQARLQSGRPPVVVDVREPGEWAAGCIPSAARVPRSKLEAQAQTLYPDRTLDLVLVCAAGRRSLMAAQALRAKGYERVASMKGGMSAWAAAGLPMDATPRFPPLQRERYRRHLVLPEVGEAGQAKLLAGKVLIVGLGGLGSPAALYLAAAGVGTLGLADGDVVDLSNLQRQVIHTTAGVGGPKTGSARRAILALNPEVKTRLHERIGPSDILEIAGGYDVVIDGSDNFDTKYLVNDACAALAKPGVFGSVSRFEGQAFTYLPGRGACYRCLFPEAPPPEAAPNCADAGVLGVLPGMIGLLQATEAIKILIGAGRPLAGRLLRMDALEMSFQEFAVSPDPACLACGPAGRPRDLVASAAPVPGTPCAGGTRPQLPL